MNSLLNDPKEWGAFIPAPTDVNVKKFQQKLTRIAGRSAISGKPVLRLVWGWDAEARDWRCGEWRARYRFHTVILNNNLKIDLSVPRWFIEELVEPIQYMDAWRQARTHIDEATGELIDVLGEPPRDGMYVWARTIADHGQTGECCRRMWESKRLPCWGQYRQPSDVDLAMAEAAVRAREESKQFNRPDEPLSPEVFADVMAAQFAFQEEKDNRLKQRASDMVDDFVNTHKHSWISDDPSVHKHGKYHFTQTPSGLFAPTT